ncbi:MAG: hypothetical protein NC127_02855 [Muribaculum sp.]|nr:hypothetical protein [Muribaculum sp.]
MTIFTRHNFLSATTLALLGLAVVVFSGCKSDNADEPYSGEPQQASISLRTASPTQSSEPGSPNELINSWWVAFAKSDGTIAAIVEKNALPSPAERDDVQCQLSRGTYTAYAFANISRSDVQTMTGLTFEVNSKVTESEIKTTLFKFSGNYKPNGFTGNIPMTGIQTIQVTDRVHEPFAIEVVRLYAKIEIEFSSLATDDITVNSIDFEPLCEGPVLLAPLYNATSAPALLTGSSIGHYYSHSLSSCIVPAGTAASAPVKASGLYLREVSDMESTSLKSLNLMLHLTRSGKSQHLRAIVEGITFINRNDYIVIPIQFTDWAIDPDVKFYPPIGGYPEADIRSQGDDFYVTFGTQGDFSLNMRVRKANIASSYLPEGRVKVNIEKVSGDDIFSKVPAFDALTGEITGTLSQTKGTAKINLSVSVTPEGDLTDASAPTYVYSRVLYIIHE